MRIISFFRKAIEPKSHSEDDRRHEFILNAILVVSILLLGLAVIVSSIDAIFEDPELRENALSLLLIVCIFFGFLILYILSRKGYFKISSHIIVAIYFLLAFYSSYFWGVEVQTGLLFYILVMVIAGVLISTNYAFVIWALTAISIIVLNQLQTNDIILPNYYWTEYQFAFGDMIVISALFLIIVTVSWLSNREIERSLKRARASEAALKKERDLLEIRVEERTKELKEIQMHRMSEVARFAEFGRLSTGLFHDLMSPLTALSLHLEEALDGKQKKQSMDEMKSDLGRAMSVTTHMSDFIHAVRKQFAAQESRENFSAQHEVEQVLTILDYHFKKANITVEVEMPNTCTLMGNPIRFHQIVTNLVSNAVDALETDEGNTERTLTITLEDRDDEIVLSVSDNGPGIPTNIQEKIFEPLFTTKQFKEGTGMGLSLIKHVVEKEFNGTITFTSTQGNGATFTVILPKHT